MYNKLPAIGILLCVSTLLKAEPAALITYKSLSLDLANQAATG